MSVDKYSKMPYVDFISLLRETNRCPGGKDTINWILQNSFANQNTRVLEIGSNTGFSSLEVARLIRANVLGIDVSEAAVAVAKQELARDVPAIQKLVNFSVASAYDIPCADRSVDLIISGGATSFMDDKSKAVSEMYRVLSDWGFCSVTNLFYHSEPPHELLDKVSGIIGVKINYMTADDWVQIYTNNKLFEVYKLETVPLEPQTSERLADYVSYFMSKPHIKSLPSEDVIAIRQRWMDILQVFNENHKYLAFIRCLLRKRSIEEEPELFKIKRW